MTEMQMYWLTRLDVISNIAKHTSCIILTITCVALLIWALIGGLKLDDGDITKKDYLLYLKKIIKFMLLTLIPLSIYMFTPTTKEMAAIIIVPKIANSEFVNKTLPKETEEIYTMAKDYLKNKLTDEKDSSK